jgi:amino acid permease
MTASLLVSYSLISQNTKASPFYVGITFCGNTTAEAKLQKITLTEVSTVATSTSYLPCARNLSLLRLSFP